MTRHEINSDGATAGTGTASAAIRTRTGGKARVLVVEDHPIVRRGLIDLIDGEADLECCGEAADADEALQLLESCAPDAAVVDVALRGRNGIDLVKDIRVRRPGLPVLVLSMYDETLYAERALRAGAMGYVMKQEATEKVLSALRRILNGHVYLSEALSSTMVRRVVVGSGAGESPLNQLSDRELEVLQLIAQGLPTREIAQRLHRSVKTIESHRENLKAKLGLRSGSELVRYAIEHQGTRAEGAAGGDGAPRT